MLRNSFKFVGRKERKEVAAELKKIYTADTAEAAKAALVRFRKVYDEGFPAIGKSCEAYWENLIPFFDYPKEIRKDIYTTNAIESINAHLERSAVIETCFLSAKRYTSSFI